MVSHDGNWKLTGHIELIARGKSDQNQYFVLMKVIGSDGTETLLVRETQLIEFKGQLESAGASIISRAAYNELEHRLQEFSSTPSTFQVATRVELRKQGMALPGGPFPKTKAFRVCLIDVPHDLQAKYQRKGKLKEWKRLCKLAIGNSRFITLLALAFVGPLSFVRQVPHVGIQLIGDGGDGKSSLGVAVSSVWGWDRDPVVADQVGFGTTWNSTRNAFERTAAAYNQVFLFLNETGVADGQGRARAEAILEVLMKIEGGIGRERLTEQGARRWYAPLLSTSNVSVAGLAKIAGKDADVAFVDRLMDLPGPEGGEGMFENLHGYGDVGEFCREIKSIAAENHGVAGRKFVKSLYEEVGKARAGLKEWLDKRVNAYIKRAKKQIVSPGRDLTRVHGRFATIYAAGRLAARFKVLPFSWKTLMNAILACEQAHVAFIDGEHSGKSHGGSLVDRFRNYLRENRSKFVDLRGAKPSRDVVENAMGFIGKHKGLDEFWLREADINRFCGNSGSANKLKASLKAIDMLISEVGKKGRARNVARRRLPHQKKDRTWVTAIPLRFVEGG